MIHTLCWQESTTRWELQIFWEAKIRIWNKNQPSVVN